MASHPRIHLAACSLIATGVITATLALAASAGLSLFTRNASAALLTQQDQRRDRSDDERTGAREQGQGREQAEPDTGSMEAAMEAWTASMTPGRAHEVMNSLVGDWTTTTRMWWGGEGSGDPMVSTGEATVAWVLDGRFLEERSKGTLMGQPMVGRGLYGFDNVKKKYTALWVDTMSTAMYFGEGTLSQDGDIITYFGEMNEPMTGEHDKTVKYVNRMVDKNTRIFEIHDLSIVPGNTKVLEVTYRRDDARQERESHSEPEGR